MNRNELIRYLIDRLAAHRETACEIDYARIEEICHLLCAAMRDLKSLEAKS